MHWYERYFQIVPEAEGIAQRLIRLYLRLGQRAEAARVFLALRWTLAAELALFPSADTMELYREVWS